jgi:hypothetical protein
MAGKMGRGTYLICTPKSVVAKSARGPSFALIPFLGFSLDFPPLFIIVFSSSPPHRLLTSNQLFVLRKGSQPMAMTGPRFFLLPNLESFAPKKLGWLAHVKSSSWLSGLSNPSSSKT